MVSDKCPQTIEGALVSHHQNKSTVLIQYLITFPAINLLGNYRVKSILVEYCKEERKIPYSYRSNRSQTHKILDHCNFLGINSTIGISRSSFSFHNWTGYHSIHMSEVTWILCYDWRLMITTGKRLWYMNSNLRQKNFTDVYFKFLVNNAMTHTCPHQLSMKSIKCHQSWSWTLFCSA